MDHYIIRIPNHPPPQRSLVIYQQQQQQHRILIRLQQHRHSAATTLMVWCHNRPILEPLFFAESPRSNHPILPEPHSSQSPPPAFFFTRETTSIMRRSRRDLQPYPPPVVVLTFRERVLEIPDDVWYRVGQCLDAPDLHSLRQSHPRLRRLLLHNAAGWKNLCRRLWSRRYHVSKAAQALLVDHGNNHNHEMDVESSSTSVRAEYTDIRAYELSCRDAQRDILTEDELCDTIWWFRFKANAGADWIRDDPWHRGEPAVKMVFLRNGRVISSSSNNNVFLLTMAIHWQWIELPALLEDDIPKDRGMGAYLRLTVSGRDVPTYVVRRFPANWGFLMENCWGVFASFELKRKKTTSLLLQLTGPVSPTTTTTNTDHHRHRDKNENDRPPRKRQKRTVVSEDDLTTECYFQINGQNQWREAFLYNIGARHIPHGPNAMEAFRHACEAALHVH